MNAAVVQIQENELHVGDMLHFRGHTTDFHERVEHIEVDHTAVESARAGQTVGVQVSQRVREHDEVYRLTS